MPVRLRRGRLLEVRCYTLHRRRRTAMQRGVVMTGIAHLEVGGRSGEAALRIAIMAVRLEVAANRWGSACQASLERWGIGNAPKSPIDPAWLPPHRRLLEHLEYLYNTLNRLHTMGRETQ